MLDPKVFKAYDVRGIYPTELDEDGAYAIGRAYVEHFEPKRSRSGATCALSSPAMAEAAIRGARTAAPTSSTSGWSAPRCSTSRSATLGARRRAHGHRLAQPEGVHRHEDRATRRAAGGRRLGPPGRPRPRAERRVRRRRGQRRDVRQEDVYPGFVERRPVVRRRRRGAAAPGRVDAANGMAGLDAPARARAPARRGRPLLLRARRHVPEPRAEPTAPGEPRVHRREGARGAAPTWASPSTATPTAASSSTTRASSSPGDFVTALLAEVVLEKEPGGDDHLRRPGELGRPRHRRAPRRTAARQPRRSRVHQASDARGGRRLRRRGVRPLLLPRLLPGRLGRRPGAARARAPLDAQARRSRRSCALTASATSSPASSTRASRTSR